MNRQSDSLLARAVGGDADALGELLLQHGPPVERRLRIDPQWRASIDTSDVMQVTYLEAFMDIRRYNLDRTTSFAAWLAQIAENNLRDAIRGLGREKRPNPQNQVELHQPTDSHSCLCELLGVTTTTPSREVGASELQVVVERALAGLPTDYAQAVRMYDLEGRPIDEIATALRRSPGAVHMLRARAHDWLRGLIGPWAASASG